MASKIPALRLVLPGAPSSWHTVVPIVDPEDGREVGLRGHYHPDKPTPLGTQVTPTLDEAKAYIAAHKKMVKAAAEGWKARRQELLDADGSDIGEFVTPACPVELTDISSQKEADELTAELIGLHSPAVRAAYLARQEGDGALPHVESQAAAVAPSNDQQEDLTNG